MSCVGMNGIHYASLQLVQLSAQKSITVTETKIEFYSHADTCVIDVKCLVVHDNNKSVNVFGFDPKAG